MPRYRIGGLTVDCELSLPALRVVTTGPADVQVVEGSVPERLAAPIAQARWWQCDRDSALLIWPAGGRFLISHGRRIDFARSTDAPGGDEGLAELIPPLLGTAFGILLHQRGRLVLHGAAVVFNGRAQVICAASGTGKSTLAAALSRSGCRLISDDLCVIATDHGAAPHVHPDGRHMKLWRDAIDHLDLSESIRGAVVERDEKFYVEPPARTSDAAVPLGNIHVLRDAGPNAEMSLRPLDTPAAMRALTEQTYRRRLARSIAGTDRYFGAISSVLRHARVFELTRPRDLSRLMPTAQALLDHWRSS
jgi:hypothetical protein